MKLKIAYLGSPLFSAYFLEKLLTDKTLPIEVKLVVTQPDKPVGRKQILTPTPVKQVALNNGLEILEIENLKLNKNFKLKIKNFDICLVFAFASIIPREFLNIPKYGFWCIHPSLLPRYRGASPIAYSLILGDKKTGVTIFQMDEKIDHGPIIAQEEIEILPTDRRPDLEIKLTDLAFKMFKKIIVAKNADLRKCHAWLPNIDTISAPTSLMHFRKDAFEPLPLQQQNHRQATYAPYLNRDDGFIPLSILKKTLKNEPLKFEELPKIVREYFIRNSRSQNPNYKQTPSSKIQTKKQISFERLKIDYWNLIGNWELEIRNPSAIIYDLFRGLFPWPGVWTILPNGKRLKITSLKLLNFKTLKLLKVQLEGKKEVDFETFNRNYKIL